MCIILHSFDVAKNFSIVITSQSHHEYDCFQIKWITAREMQLWEFLKSWICPPLAGNEYSFQVGFISHLYCCQWWCFLFRLCHFNCLPVIWDEWKHPLIQSRKLWSTLTFEPSLAELIPQHPAILRRNFGSYERTRLIFQGLFTKNNKGYWFNVGFLLFWMNFFFL